MDKKELKEEIRQEVIAELMPVYKSAIQDLDVNKRIVAEKEKIFDFLIKIFIEKIAIANAKNQAIEDIKKKENVEYNE